MWFLSFHYTSRSIPSTLASPVFFSSSLTFVLLSSSFSSFDVVVVSGEQVMEVIGGVSLSSFFFFRTAVLPILS